MESLPEENQFLSSIIKKYEFILAIYLTDCDGALITAEKQKGLTEDDFKEEVYSALAYDFSMSLDQISKTEKWKTQSLITFYDKHVLFQNKLNKVAFCHIVCREEDYAHEVVKKVVKDIKQFVDKVEDKLESIRQGVITN